MNIHKAIEGYRSVREKKQEMQKAHKEQLAPLNTVLDKLERYLLAEMRKEGVKNFKTESGTAFQESRNSVTVKDWKEFLDYVKSTDSWGLLAQRASKAAVDEFIADTEELPPGLKMVSELTVKVRK